jgi:import inner membrane translocase subunit TIM44
VEQSGDLLKKGRTILSSMREGVPGGGAQPGTAAGAPGADGSEEAQQASGQQTPPPPPPPPPRSASTSALSRARAWAASAAETAAAAVRAEVRLAMMDEGDAAAERARERAAAAPAAAPGPINTSASAVVITKPRVSAWQRRWGALRNSAAASPLFARLGAAATTAATSAASAPVVRRTRDAAADLRERWETSDSPIVHRLQDMGDSMRMEETEAARTLAAIRSLQPDFDMHEFVAIVKRDVAPILRAYLAADVASLKAAGLAPELLERLGAMMAAWRAEGTVMDTQILDVSDLEVMETKMVGNAPMVVLQFQIQQINCVRDKAGLVIEGAADDIQSVYYAWAMELVVPKPGEDAAAPARWRLRDMMVRGMHAIV